MTGPLKRARRGVDAKGRSKGYEKHVRLHRWMMRSPAWKALSLPARCLLIELYDLHDGTNNGAIFLSVREAAARLGIGKNLAHKLFGELQEKGFIRAHQLGSFSLKVKHASTWILTEFEHAGQLPTKEFMRWRPVPEKQNSVPPGGTIGPSARDRGHEKHPEKAPVGPSARDRERLNGYAVGPSRRDTDSIPGRGAFPRSASSAAQHEAAASGAEQVDLEEAIAAAEREGIAEQPSKFGDPSKIGDLPSWMRGERTRRGWPPSLLGEITGLGESGILNIEEGRATVTKTMQRRIVAALTSEVRP